MKVEEIDGITIIVTDKRLDNIDGPKLKDVVKETCQEHGIKLVIDMQKASFLDSSGCGGLISALKTVLCNFGEIRIVRPSTECVEILRMTRLHRVFEIHDTLENAIQSFHQL